jgi:hypothetical protein
LRRFGQESFMKSQSFLQFTVKLGAIALLTLPTAAFAGTCITNDPNTDGLSEGDRKSALGVLAGTLEQEGKGPITADQCTETYNVNHAKLGNSVTVTLKGPQGSRTGTVGRVDDLPQLYSQLVRSLISGKPVDGLGDNVTRDNVTPRQAAPLRMEADSLWYVNLGYGAVVGPAFANGPGFGFGYRYELDSFALDASAQLVWGGVDTSNHSSGVAGSWLRLQGLYYLSPTDNRSAYMGGGVSWGGTENSKDGRSFSNSGLQGEATVGYEFFRATTVRLFAQLNATLPFYMARGADTYDFNTFTATASTESRYIPTFLLSMGIAFGRNHALMVHQY